MPHDLGFELPAPLVDLLDGSDPRRHLSLALLLSTVDEAGWPRLAMLSVGEVVCVGMRDLRLALWPYSTTTSNLVRTARAVLSTVVSGHAYQVRVTAERRPDLDLEVDGGQLAVFALRVERVYEDAAEYATLTSGVTFRLHDAEDVLRRWRRTIAALRSSA